MHNALMSFDSNGQRYRPLWIWWIEQQESPIAPIMSLILWQRLVCFCEVYSTHTDGLIWNGNLVITLLRCVKFFTSVLPNCTILITHYWPPIVPTWRKHEHHDTYKLLLTMVGIYNTALHSLMVPNQESTTIRRPYSATSCLQRPKAHPLSSVADTDYSRRSNISHVRICRKQALRSVYVSLFRHEYLAQGGPVLHIPWPDVCTATMDTDGFPTCDCYIIKTDV